MARAAAAANKNDCDDAHFKLESCKIILKQGDLMAEEDVDVIVIPIPDSDQDNRFQTYPLYDALLSKATNKAERDRIKSISSKMRSARTPQFIMISNKSYILTTTPYYQNPKTALTLLRDVYTNCLHVAINEKCQTIAFPTIGCGNSGFQTEEAARMLHDGLVQFSTKETKQFKEIRIVVYKKDVHGAFVSFFVELGGHKTSKIKFIEISPSKSNSEKMAWKGGGSSDAQRFRQDRNEKDYDDDFDDEDRNSHGQGSKKRSGLNPDSAEFRPKGADQDRDIHRYYINDKKTELHIIKGDILKIKVDAIVNAANEMMLGGAGVDGVVHDAAGSELLKACKLHKEISRDVRLPTGRSRILLSYNLSKTTYYIINTAGPRYDDHAPQKSKQYLTSCYETSLALANLYDLETIAYTAISCGIFGYPPKEGARVALSTVNEKADKMEKIYFVLRDEDLFQTWIEQAEKLKFLSMDEPQSKETSAPKQSIAHSSSVLKQDGSDGNSHGSKWDAPTRVNDRSTADHVEKPVESNRQKSANNRDTDNTRHDDARNTDDRDANNTRHNATRNADKDAGQTEEEKNKEKEKSEKNKKDKSSPQESPTKGATPKNGSKAPTGSHRRDESPSKGKPKKT